MAVAIAVSVSMGVMKPLLAKLTMLMGDKYKKLKGLRKEVSFLKDELTTIDALLENMDKAVELDSLAKNWRKQVIEMSYDIEDCIDDFMHCVGEADHKVGIIQKVSHYLKSCKDQNRIANQIQEIKTRVIQTSERRMRYKLDESISNTTSVIIDPRISVLYKELSSLVGIDVQKEELVKWVMGEEKQLKVVSIVGFGGIGKTTLANEVYRQVRGQFNCKAFVSVSQRLDIRGLLNSVKLQIGLPPSSYPCEVQDLINNLGEYLREKRYLIVVDDLWDVRAWNIIKCIFPQNNQHSRVMITTRIAEVARACCIYHGHIHRMKPLSEPDARKLFFNRIFGPEDSCPSQFIEVSCEILKKCRGLPLAIITVASILASQPAKLKEQWDYIQNSLAAEFEADPTLEDMMHILDLSYKNLPRHLKACFLYLGIYPEDYHIRRDDLVRQWVAEGFVISSPGRDAWDIAKNYFNELVNRSMIQPTYEDHDIEVLSCRVHDMMLDLIIRRCTEDNFFSVLRDVQAVAPVQEKVRRLSLHLSSVDDGTMPLTTADHLSQVRSVAIFGGSQCIPAPLLEFKFLRVLFLDLSSDAERIDLTGIAQLSQLRYLRVKCRAWRADVSVLSIVLPSRIGRLRYLETLELPTRSSCSVIMKDMAELPCLSHLVLPPGTRFPEGIGKLKSLRTLDGFSLAKNSLENTRGLSELTNLENLSLINSREAYMNNMIACADDGDTLESSWIAALSSSLGKLGSLKRLSMVSFYGCCCGDALDSFCPPFKNLEQLDLSGWVFSGVPKWIGSLHNLRNLELTFKFTCREDVGIIGMLPSLVELILRIPGLPTERVVIGSTGFALLKILRFDCDAMSYLTFEVGAMPKLWHLTLGLHPDEWDKATPMGLQNLSALKQIEVWRAAYYDTSIYADEERHKYSDPALIRGVFQDAVDALPCRPAFILKKGCTRRPRTE